MIFSNNNKSADQTVVMHRLVSAFVVCKPLKTDFLTSRLTFCLLSIIFPKLTFTINSFKSSECRTVWVPIRPEVL